MKMQKYTVLREHFGDKAYVKGDEREADANEVAHLVANGVLELKAENPVQNKAVQAPSNKAK
jgi:hypothetical protein